MTFMAASEHCAARPSQQKFEQLRAESAKHMHMSRTQSYVRAGTGAVLELAISRRGGVEDATFPVPSDFTANCPFPQFHAPLRA